jgi:hypothetical protein
MKCATIYQRGNKIYVHSLSRTTAGVWVINNPVLMVEAENPRRLGESLRECLAASSEGMSHPKSFGGLFDPVLSLAGVKSFNTFVKAAKCVEVELDDQTAILIPTRNEGSEDGFVPLPEKSQIANNENEALGSAAISALALAE